MRTMKAKSYPQHVREGKKKEHTAIYQCLLERNLDAVVKVDDNNQKRFGSAKDKAKKSGKIIRIDD
ncbi:MAG: hypothetical protein MK132_00135 [Lentisphaerales bacterium]|nr:hypothetical protein [Lentisphaerales bacterium]